MRILQRLHGIIRRGIIMPKHNHRFHLRPQRLRIGPPSSALLHPPHLTVVPGGEEFLQARLGFRRHIGLRESDGGEAEGEGLLADGGSV